MSYRNKEGSLSLPSPWTGLAHSTAWCKAQGTMGGVLLAYFYCGFHLCNCSHNALSNICMFHPGDGGWMSSWIPIDAGNGDQNVEVVCTSSLTTCIVCPPGQVRASVCCLPPLLLTHHIPLHCPWLWHTVRLAMQFCNLSGMVCAGTEYLHSSGKNPMERACRVTMVMQIKHHTVAVSSSLHMRKQDIYTRF